MVIPKPRESNGGNSTSQPKTEIGHDLPHHDLGGCRLDRSLADTLPVRRERSDHMALAQLTEGTEHTIVTGHATTSDIGVEPNTDTPAVVDSSVGEIVAPLEVTRTIG